MNIMIHSLKVRRQKRLTTLIQMNSNPKNTPHALTSLTQSKLPVNNAKISMKTLMKLFLKTKMIKMKSELKKHKPKDGQNMKMMKMTTMTTILKSEMTILTMMINLKQMMRKQNNKMKSMICNRGAFNAHKVKGISMLNLNTHPANTAITSYHQK